LSSSITVGCYQTLVEAGDRAALANFVIERFEERYFRPVIDSKSKHGFTVMAIACLIIETLESFYQGRADTKRFSKKMFSDFFARCSGLESFGENGDWFFTDIRCGILHQAETLNGWKILRSGPLLESKNKVINATALMKQLQKAARLYAKAMQSDEILWKNFCKKVDAICNHCQ
jgi:hypothetical protein